MDNKKLLNFLLKDLSELDELFDDKTYGDFDELEMEFLQTRLKSSKKLVSILLDRENQAISETSTKSGPGPTEEVIVLPENTDEEIEPVVVEEKSEIPEQTEEISEEITVEKEEIPEPETELKIEMEDDRSDDEMELEDEEVENPNRTLGDSFLKEKSVNDILASTNGKLEYKLSNRPVESIQTAIGINDRFQYIRELFDGKSDVFSKTVTDIDNMNDIKEAVHYLQQNFKWKKNETSLKFVNLVKRRFLNE